MINRRSLRCISCGQRTITRTGIGHADIQKHKFACPGCGVEIGFVLNLDQTAVTFEYEKPINAEWNEDEDPGDPQVLFYPELMVPKQLPNGLSPFIATFGCHKDIGQYQQVEAARRLFKEKLWPTLQRAYVHLENGNLDLLKKECETLTKAGGVPDFLDREERGAWVMGATRHFFDFFVIDPAKSEPVERSIAFAYRHHEVELRKLADEYVKSGRVRAIWKEVKSVRKQFIYLYESFLPLLMVRRYWKPAFQEISEYELSVKNFEDIKGFYIDAVETAFRLLVIGLGIELIVKTGKPIISTKTGDKNIWWFEQLNNGIKDGQLRKHAIFSSITPELDLALRNGVGHHAAHYDVATDEIAYAKADDASLNESRISYTGFIDKAFKAYCAFEITAGYFHWLFVAGGGRF
jgi:hypothetical protein